MSVKLPPPLHFQTVLGAVDLEARRTATRARTASVAAVKRVLPAHTGRARRGTRGSVRRTPTGYVIEVRPDSRVRYPNGVSAVQVHQWLEGGTGEQGPRHQRIPFERRGRLPSGRRPSGRGQAPQRPYARVAAAEGVRVTRLLQDGGPRAMQAANRALGGT